MIDRDLSGNPALRETLERVLRQVLTVPEKHRRLLTQMGDPSPKLALPAGDLSPAVKVRRYCLPLEFSASQAEMTEAHAALLERRANEQVARWTGSPVVTL